MRIVLAAALLSGCTTMTDATEPALPAAPAAPAAPAEAKCDLAPLNGLIGQPASAELGADALRMSGAKALRWKPPGAIVTMDYRPDRLNVSLDEQNQVTAFDCG